MKNHSEQSFNFFSWFRKNYMVFIIMLLFIYLFFAFSAPVLMKLEFSKLGKFIYVIYSNFCHQFAHRSWFLFGEQLFYPTSINADSGLRSLHDVFGIFPDNIQKSREIIGNKSAGYKVAICQRDVAIYGAMLIVALIFQLSRKKIKKLPFWIWFSFAIIPIGTDGVWQLISSSNISIINIFSHESTPMIRSITGILFGFFTGWYIYPAIEETFEDESAGIIKKVKDEEGSVGNTFK